jgi:hypothetical protein
MDGAEEYLTGQLQPEQAATSQTSQFSAIREGLPAGQQVLITDVARKFGLQDDDPLWSIVAALQLHTNYAREIPAELKEAGDHIGTLMQFKINLIEQTLDNVVLAATEARATIKTAAELGAVAAVEASLKKLDSNKIVIELAQKMAAGSEAAKRHYWSKLGMIAMAIMAALSFAGGWGVAIATSSVAPNYVFSTQLSALAECIKTSDKQISCKLKGQK